MPTLLRAHAIRMANGVSISAILGVYQNARPACAKLHNPSRDGAMGCPPRYREYRLRNVRWAGWVCSRWLGGVVRAPSSRGCRAKVRRPARCLGGLPGSRRVEGSLQVGAPRSSIAKGPHARRDFGLWICCCSQATIDRCSLFVHTEFVV
jgi:hypothetical protein